MRERITILSEKILILIATSFLVFLSCYFSLGRFLGIHKYDRAHMLLGLCVISLILWWVRQEQTKKVWSVTIFLALLLAITWFWGIEHLKAFINEYPDWILGRTAEHKEWENIYYFLQISIIAIVCTIAGAIIQYITIVRKAMTFVLVIVPVASYFVEYPLSQRAVAFLLIFFVFLWIQWKQEKWEKCRSESNFKVRNRAYMFYMAPFLLLFSLVLCVVPVKQEPIKWTVIRNIISRIEDGIQKLSFNRRGYLQEDFDNLLVEMSENTDLRGRVESQNKQLMTIRVNGMKRGYLYLTGSIMASFDGREWTETKPLTEEDIYPDTYELKYAVRRSEGLFGDYYSLINVDVEYEKFHSQNSFLPIKAHEWTNADPLFGKNKMLGYGTTYQVSYLQMNLDSGLFDELLMNTPEDRENVWLSCQPIGEKRMSFQNLMQYREKMQKLYGVNPYLSKEVEEWKTKTLNDALSAKQGNRSIEELTAYEKFRIWERALSEFTYTKEPGELPQYVQSPAQFMDFFLLDSKKGYCTYFATAMVMLARSEGYPARISQGFAIPYEGEAEIKVYGDRAHAWPEIYFEGVGWIPFEPTPGYAAGRYQPWKVSREFYDDNDYTDSSVIDKNHDPRPEQVGEKQEEKVATVSMQEKMQKVLSYFIRGIIAVIILILFVALVMLIYLRITVYRFRKKGIEEQFSMIFNKNISMLEKLGYKREEAETIAEFATRMKMEGEVVLSKTFLYQEEVSYGEKEITRDMTRALWEEQKGLLSMLQNKEQKKIFLLFEKILVASLNEYV